MNELNPMSEREDEVMKEIGKLESLSNEALKDAKESQETAGSLLRTLTSALGKVFGLKD